MAAKKNVTEEQTRAYVESQAKAASPIFTCDMICKDCEFRDDKKSGICEKFPLGVYKPAKVYGGECDEYKKE